MSDLMISSVFAPMRNLKLFIWLEFLFVRIADRYDCVSNDKFIGIINKKSCQLPT